MPKFQLQLDGEWKDYLPQESAVLQRAFMDDFEGTKFSSRGQEYYVDFKNMLQRNVKTGKERKIRIVHGGAAPPKSRDSSPDHVVVAQPAAAAHAHPHYPPPCVGVAAPVGYATGPAYVAGPAYSAPSGPAYGEPPPYIERHGGRPGISPMTAGLVAGGAGLVGGMLLEHALDRPEVVVVDDGFGYDGFGYDDWW